MPKPLRRIGTKKSKSPLIFLIGLVVAYLLYTRYSAKSITMTSGQTWLPKSTSKIPNDVYRAISNALSARGVNDVTILFWMAVSGFETGNWTSQIYTENNNLWGMRLATSNTTAIGDNAGFADYTSIQDSAQDLALYLTRLKWAKLNFASLQEFVHQMKLKNYFVEPEDQYLAGVTAVYNQLFAL